MMPFPFNFSCSSSSLCMSVTRRILFISTNPAPWGGSEEMWHQLALSALEDGHKIMISVFRHPRLNTRIQELVAAGARLHLRPLPAYYEDQPFLQWILSHLMLRLHWDRLPFIWGRALAFAPEHMFISGGETLDGCLFAESYIIRRAIATKIPYSVVGHFHHEHSKVLSQGDRASKRIFLRMASGLYFVSHRNWQMTCNELQDALPDARVIFNPIREISTRTRIIPTEGTIRIALVARLECAVKCQDLAINTLAQKAFRDVDFTLDLYGEGPDRTYLEDLIRFHGLEDKVRLMGHHSAPGNIWDDHDLLVLTSRGEGTPLVILEAMRAGIPALVTRAGDSALWINNDRGYVAEAISIESLTDTFLRAFRGRADWHAKGVSCRAFFEHVWTEDHQQALYKSVIGMVDPGSVGVPAQTLPHMMSSISHPSQDMV